MAKFIQIVNGIPRMQEESAATVIYNDSVTIASPLSAGTPLALPNSKTYDSKELEVYLNTQRMESVTDYNYEGTVPRTTISFTYDLGVGDIIRFRIDRIP